MKHEGPGGGGGTGRAIARRQPRCFEIIATDKFVDIHEFQMILIEIIYVNQRKRPIKFQVPYFEFP